MIKPLSLKNGSKIALIAPASGFNRDKFVKGIALWEKEFGLIFTHREDIFETEDYLAGSDERRVNELNEAFSSDAIDGIFLVRGGYGSSRLMPKIDWEALKKKPKVVCGFSDATILLNQITSQTEVVTFHGLMPATEAGNSPNEKEIEFFKHCLFSGSPMGFVASSSYFALVEGEAEGAIVGGNLCLLASTLGTSYEINLKNKILFIEDVNEAPYRIDRTLTQLNHAGKLSECLGIICGSFNERDQTFTREREDEYFRAVMRGLEGIKIPVLAGFPAGHGSIQGTFPIGVQVRLTSKSTDSSVEFLESGVL